MRYFNRIAFMFSGFLLISAAVVGAAVVVTAQEPAALGNAQSGNTLERGYRTGYSDGYQSGLRDVMDRANRDFRSKSEYRSADRAYVATYGSLEDYRDGYRQGFEAGYNAGFDQRSFDSSAPVGLTRRGTARGTTDTPVSSPAGSTTQGVSGVSTNVPDNAGSRSSSSSNIPPANSGTIAIPGNAVMRVELLNNLSTAASKRGDHFQVRVLEPREYEGATIEGRVTNVTKAGRGHGSAELQLSFESIHLTDGRSSTISAQVIEVITPGGDTGVKDVDPEGGVRGKSSTKDSVAKIGAGAGIGAILGGITGGGAGAAIGAAIGGGVSTGGVLASRGKQIHLYHGQQLKIRTATETRF